MRPKIPTPEFRICPSCNKQIPRTGDTYYHKFNFREAIKNKVICLECRNDSYKIKFLGKNNPFYGKKHSKDTLLKLIKHKNSSEYLSKLRDHNSAGKNINLGTKNGMFGKSFYDVWIEKYGIDEANKRRELKRQKTILQTSGSNNPMYGKPAPKGTGAGWSGWYNEWYFRSLRELTYVLDFLEEKYSWISLDSKDGSKYVVKYVDQKGNQRTYRADFLVDNKIMVEIKPSHLMVLNKLKLDAAEEYCKLNGLSYKMIDVVINEEKIKSLYESGKIKFSERTMNFVNKRWEK